MSHELILIFVLLVSFFQILHIFEEISLRVYELRKSKNKQGLYLKVASVLVFFNYIVICLLYLDFRIAYYIAFYSVLISIGNMIAHFILMIKYKKSHGYGFLSSIPLGIAGIILLVSLISYFSAI